jgi:hypothetical protein
MLHKIQSNLKGSVNMNNTEKIREYIAIINEKKRLDEIINTINTDESLKLFRIRIIAKDGGEDAFSYLIELDRKAKETKVYFKKGPCIVSLTELGFVTDELIDLVFILVTKSSDTAKKFVKLVISNNKILQMSNGNVLDAINLIQQEKVYTSIVSEQAETYIKYIDKNLTLYKSNIESLKMLYDIYLDNVQTLNWQYQICDETYELKQRIAKFGELIKSE